MQVNHLEHRYEEQNERHCMAILGHRDVDHIKCVVI